MIVRSFLFSEKFCCYVTKIYYLAISKSLFCLPLESIHQLPDQLENWPELAACMCDFV